jgi:hypothetical protein
MAGGILPPKERTVQRAILAMAGTCFPDVFIHHSTVPKLWGDPKQRAMVMGAMKGDGFKVGFPDLLCIWRGGMALIEVKRPKVGLLSDEQAALHDKIANLGWPVNVVTSVDEAHSFLKGCGAPCRGELS